MVQVYGTVCLDVLKRVQKIPPLGGYVEVEETTMLLGGEAANTAAQLAAFGVECQLIGNAMSGVDVARLMAGAKIENYALPQSEFSAPVCDIYVTPDGERTMFGQGFRGLEKRHALGLLNVECDGWLTVDDNHGEAAREAVRRAHDWGKPVYAMDLVRDQEPLLHGDILQTSTDWMDGIAREDVVSKAREWTEKYGIRVVITDGANGFVYSAPGRGVVELPSLPCPYRVDSTGAGDAFRAGMLCGVIGGWPIDKTLAFAAAAGAMACTRLGGAANAPSKDAVVAHVLENKEIADRYAELVV